MQSATCGSVGAHMETGFLCTCTPLSDVHSPIGTDPRRSAFTTSLREASLGTAWRNNRSPLGTLRAAGDPSARRFARRWPARSGRFRGESPGRRGRMLALAPSSRRPSGSAASPSRRGRRRRPRRIGTAPSEPSRDRDARRPKSGAPWRFRIPDLCRRRRHDTQNVQSVYVCHRTRGESGSASPSGWPVAERAR